MKIPDVSEQFLFSLHHLLFYPNPVTPSLEGVLEDTVPPPSPQLLYGGLSRIIEMTKA